MRYGQGSVYAKSELSDEMIFSESMAEQSIDRRDHLENVLSQNPSQATLVAHAQAILNHKSSTGTLLPYSASQLQLPTANQGGGIREDSYQEEEEDVLNQIFSLERVQAPKPHDNINKKKGQLTGSAIIKQGGLFFDGLTGGVASNLDFAGDRRPVRMKDVDYRNPV